jgi:hypothetical protein
VIKIVLTIEQDLVETLAREWLAEGKLVTTELTIPVINQIYYDNYLEGRDYVRIDLAALDKETDEIIFVEAENGLYLQHPQIYLPFCHSLYILCPCDNSSFREEQVEWSKSQGIGIIEKNTEGELITTLESKSRRIYPAVEAFVKSRLLKKIEKERK